MEYEKLYGPDKSFEQLIYKTVACLMENLNLEDFEPGERGLYDEKQTNLICEKFKNALNSNTYWSVKSPSSGAKDSFTLILKSTTICITFVFEPGKIKITHPGQNVADINLNFVKMWLSFMELRQVLIKILVESVKMAHGLR